MPLLQVGNRTVSCQGILFDKDGTLLDFMSMWGAWAELVLIGMEKNLKQRGTEFIGNSAKWLGTEHDASGKVIGYDPRGPLPMATTDETHGLLAWQLYAAGAPWNEALAQVTHITSEAMKEVRKRRIATPIEGVVSFLKQCNHASIKLGVVTSDEAGTTAEHLEWLGITELFGTIVTRDRVKYGKPATEMVELACQELGLTPESTILIGDSNADMQMGKAAGLCLTIGIAGQEGNNGHLIQADTIITDFTELLVTP